MYFGHFPLIPYDSVGDGEFKLVTNLLKRVAVRSKVKTNVLVFDTYDVRMGETPEEIADKLYNDPELHWVVLMMNDITDRYNKWPLIALNQVRKLSGYVYKNVLPNIKCPALLIHSKQDYTSVFNNYSIVKKYWIQGC